MTGTSHWSSTTALDWEHGLPVGNGTIGAVVFGAPSEHFLTIAHERVVLPIDPIRTAPNLAPDLPRIRALVDTGQAQDAAVLGYQRAQDQGYPRLQWTDPLVPTALVGISTQTNETWSDYRRSTDTATGVATIGWTADSAESRIRVFVSAADGTCILEVTGNSPTVALRNPTELPSAGSDGNASRVAFEYHELHDAVALSERFVVDWPMAVPRGATTVMRVLDRGADRTLLALAVVPQILDPQAIADRAEQLAALPPDFDELLHRHRDHMLTSAPDLSLNVEHSGQPTEVLLASAAPHDRRELIQLQYRSTLSLIEASTGEFPPTLQGTWSGSFDPAWSSDYTLNGNVQNGSIAATLSGDNPGQLRVYLDMLERFTADFAENSRQLFGTSGYVLPSRCSVTHGKTTHFDAEYCHEFWTAGGAWSACWFLDYCWYTADIDYLAQHAYPFARQVERFYEDFLIEADNQFIFNPSYSPENTSPTFGSQACRNATMDRAALYQLLVGLRRASQLIGEDVELDERRTRWISQLPPYRVAPDGTLAEWLDDGSTERLGHRHASQLFGLWFEPDPDLVADGPLRDAVARLIRAKLDWRSTVDGREEMSFGVAQLGRAAAAIKDAGLASDCIDRMSKLYFLPSLATTTDPAAIFNVDICGGFPALIHAMLVGSTLDAIDLLPALPPAWPAGSIRGLAARGGIKVKELSWSPDRIQVTLIAGRGSSRLRQRKNLDVRVPPSYRFAATGTDHIETELADGTELTLTAIPGL